MEFYPHPYKHDKRGIYVCRHWGCSKMNQCIDDVVSSRSYDLNIYQVHHVLDPLLGNHCVIYIVILKVGQYYSKCKHLKNYMLGISYPNSIKHMANQELHTLLIAKNI